MLRQRNGPRISLIPRSSVCALRRARRCYRRKERLAALLNTFPHWKTHRSDRAAASSRHRADTEHRALSSLPPSPVSPRAALRSELAFPHCDSTAFQLERNARILPPRAESVNAHLHITHKAPARPGPVPRSWPVKPTPPSLPAGGQLEKAEPRLPIARPKGSLPVGRDAPGFVPVGPGRRTFGKDPPRAVNTSCSCASPPSSTRSAGQGRRQSTQAGDGLLAMHAAGAASAWGRGRTSDIIH